MQPYNGNPPNNGGGNFYRGPASNDRNQLMSFFRSADKDGNGHICAQELQSALSNGSWTPFNAETVRLMIGMFDRDNSGTITFDEFSALWKYINDWQGSFRTYDRDNSGRIDRHELNKALTDYGYRLSDSLMGILIRKFDRQGVQSVAFDDFIQCCVTLQMLTESFKRYDTNRTGWINVSYEQFLTMVFTLEFGETMKENGLPVSPPEPPKTPPPTPKKKKSGLFGGKK